MNRLPRIWFAVIVLSMAPASARATDPDRPPVIEFKHLLKLVQERAPEEVVLRMLKESPTRFVLGKGEEDVLRKAGASEAVLTAARVQASRPALGDITDIAVLLDCSGSMIDKTRDGMTKIEAAKEYVSAFLGAIPNGRRVTFIIFGHDKNLSCQAVRVIRPLGPLDDEGKAQLLATVAGLKPGGKTPLASALRAAGTELERNDGLRAIVLVSDGVDTCGGDPGAVAETLARDLKLGRGVDVIAIGVSAEEEKKLKEITDRSNGKFRPTETAAGLKKEFEQLKKEIAGPAAPGLPAGIQVDKGLTVADWQTFRRLTRFGPEDGIGLWYARMSGDGSRLVLATDKGTYTLKTDPAAKPVRLGGAYNHPERVAISRDGNTVAWVDGDGVFVARGDGTGKVKMPGGFYVDAIQLSGNGERLFMISESAGALYTLPTDGSDLKKLTTTADVARLAEMPPANHHWRTNPGVTSLAVSDDGSRVVFRFGPQGPAPNLAVNVFTLKADSTELKQLTAYSPERPGAVGHVGISGDGRALVHVVTAGKDAQTLRVTDADGKDRGVYSNVGEVDSLQVSSDGSQVAVSGGLGVGLRVFAADGTGWKAPLRFGYPSPKALDGARGVTMTGDFRRAALLVHDVHNFAFWPQVTIVDFRPATLEGVPTIESLSLSPRFLTTDGLTTAEVGITAGGPGVLGAGVSLHREGPDMLPVAETVWLVKADQATEGPLGFTTNQLRLKKGTQEATPGPVTLRVGVVNADKNGLVIDVAGLKGKSP